MKAIFYRKLGERDVLEFGQRRLRCARSFRLTLNSCRM
jgi:hypothetical protein